MLGTDLTRIEGAASDQQVEDLRLQVRNLERLLGQRTLEIAILNERLGKVTDDEMGKLLLSLSQQFVGKYTDADGVRTVASYSVFGLNAAYTGLRNLTLSLGVKNALDTDPPYTRQAQSFQVGYDPALTDPTGRFWYASLRYRFK